MIGEKVFTRVKIGHISVLRLADLYSIGRSINHLARRFIVD